MQLLMSQLLMEMVIGKCRLCLCESSEIQSIFDSQLYQSVPLSVKIAVCISLPITQEDHFSKVICKSCRMLVDQFYSFRESCMSNYIQLLGLECSRITELEDLISVSYDMNLKPIEANSQQMNGFKSVELDDLTGRTGIDIDLAMEHTSNFSKSKSEHDHPENETAFMLQDAGTLSEDDDNSSGNKLLESSISAQFVSSDVGNELKEVPSDLEKAVSGDNIGVEDKLITDAENCGESDAEVVYSEFEEIIDPSSHYVDHEAMVDEVNTGIGAPANEHLYQDQVESKNEDHIEESHFICNTCSKVFLTSSLLNEHYEEGPCSEETGDMQEELPPLHEDTVEFEGDADEIDPKHEVKESADLEGRARWGEKRKYPCETCRKTFKTPAGLRNHVRMHTGERPFLCSLCTQSFSQRGALLNHERKHRGEWPYSCQHCGKGFFRPSDLEKHMRSHTNERPYLCSTCSKGFHQLSGLVVHERIHSGERPYSCNICQMTFTQLSNKYRHMKTHADGMKPFDCDICHRKFAEQTEMEMHRAVHDGAKPRICHFCNKGFRKPYELRDHLRRSHTNERPFICQLCNKSFFVAHDLKNHLYIHTGERPFSCNLCSQTFTQSGNLKRHHLRHHPNSPFLSIDNKPATLLYIQHVGMEALQNAKFDTIE